jgi:DNA-binding HxlR family transcriptional regulator
MATRREREPDWKPLSAAAAVLRHKWTPVLVRDLLDHGSRRFSDLARFDGLSNKVLSENLDRLQSAELVDREVVEEKPVRVRYSLTESGRELAPAIDALEEWGRSHRSAN